MRQKGFAHLILLLVIGIVLVGGYALYQKGNIQLNPNKTVAEITPTAIPTQIVEPISDIEQPTESLSISPKSTQSVKVTIPSDWKQFTASDYVKTTMSLPPKFYFSFSGSEFTIGNQEGELWSYETSVIWNDSKGVTNTYTGGSRRDWYQKNLNGDFLPEKPQDYKAAKIDKVTEHPIGNTSYLEMQISGGSLSKNQTVYLYAQNNIIHMIGPVSEKAESSNAQLPKVTDKVFYSLSSSIVKN